MRKFLLFVSLGFVALTVKAQCVTNVNFNTWSQAGQPGNGNWSVQGGGTQIYQSVNGAPTFFISPFEMMNVHVSGTFRTTDDDDDWMGFVFSFLNPMGATDSFDCWLFDWKQDFQNSSPRGKSLCRVNGVIPGSAYGTTFNAHQNTPEFTVVQNDFGGPGWTRNYNHIFDLYLTYTRATIYVDNVLTFDWQDCFKPGRFGFYNLSQRDCYYANFQYQLHIDFWYPQRVCRGDAAAFNFINPCVTSLGQYQSLTWNFGDGTAPVVISNPTLANVNVTHTYTAAGIYTASLTVVDANGCSSTATHNVDVRNPIVLTPVPTPPLCNGGSNGSIGVNATGGFGNYQYSWNGGANLLQTYAGVTAGTYTVSVTDGTCNTTAQFTLTQPTPLTATTSHTDASCGLNNGSVTITPQGGTPPYQGVSWAGVPGATRTNLGPGMYIADFRDANNCSALLQYRETVGSLPCGVTASASVTNVSCWGGNNGTATLTVGGSTPPVTITWSNGSTGATATGLAAGTYTYNYSDANPSHTFSGTVTVTQPGAAMVAQMTTIPITCAGANNGQAVTSVVSGGVPPYNYVWSGGQPNNPVANNLAPGNVTVTVTDSRSCTATATGTISGVPSLAATLNMVIDSCYHSGRGSLTASVSGGSPPYSFAWSNFDQDSSNLNITEGTYTVTITDANGCSITRSGTVTGPTSPLSSPFTVQDVTCFGANNGSFNVTTSGGTPGYTYAWTPGTLSGSNPTGLAAGIYSFTVTDSYGCRVFGEDTVFQPATALSATSSHTNITCNGAANGTITITISGGTPPYTYQGLPVPGGTNTLTGLSAGTYSGTVQDATGCSVSLSETIIEPAVFALSEAHSNLLCNGTGTGSITVTASGGTLPYSFLWNDGNINQNRTNLSAGNYSLTSTDSNFCSASVSVSITEPAVLSITETHVDVLCNGGATGSITTATAGGTPAYSYLWNDGDTNPNRTNITAGTYSVLVTDNNSCTASVSATITEPAALLVTTSHTDVTCFGFNDGTITVNISGGTASYSFLGNNVPAGTTTISGLGPNTYMGNLTDANSCSVFLSETIVEPTAINITETHTDATCNGKNDGTIDITVTGGTPAYSFTWNDAATTEDRANIVAGCYTVTVTDNNNCPASLTVCITEPPAPVLPVATIDAVCFGGSGSATANPAGGGVFTYNWSNGGNTQTISPHAGAYTVTATDANSCNQSASFSINEPPQISITETHSNVSCFGGADGSITLTVAGGSSGSYTYVWNPNVSTTNSALGLSVGNYDVVVSDVNQCTASISVSVTSPTQVIVNATSANALCFGTSTGSVIASASGGTGAVNYTLSDGTNTQSSSTGQFNFLAAGTYTVVATDASLCTATTSVNVGEPSQIVSTANVVEASCFGFTDGQITATASGGTPPYSYSLSTGAQNILGMFTGLAAGNYSLSVSDANNCSTSVSVTVSEPPVVIISVNPDTAILDMGETILLSASTNQTRVVTYNWQPGIGLSCTDCPNPLFTGNYSSVFTVTATTDFGCSGTTVVNVTVVPSYDIFIPNAFTPNGDGVNDVWQLFGKLLGIKQLEVAVFNRWGEKVFESRDINFAWDGSYKGILQNPGVYVYTAKLVWLNNHSDNKYHGSVTLIK